MIPKKDWTDLSQRTIWHGRRVCHARKPACGACALARTARRTGWVRPTRRWRPSWSRPARRWRCRGDPRGVGGRRGRRAGRRPARRARPRPRRRRPAGTEPVAAPPARPRAPRPPPARCPTCRCPASARPRARRPCRCAGSPAGRWWSTSGPAGARRAGRSCRRWPGCPGPRGDRLRVVGVASLDVPANSVSFAADNRLPFPSPAGPGRRPGARAAPQRAAGDRAGPPRRHGRATSTRARRSTDTTLRELVQDKLGVHV